MRKTYTCKINYKYINNNYGFVKNKTYKYVLCYLKGKDENYKRYMVYCDNIPLGFDNETFNEYFIDTLELRKLKLEKLNETYL